MLKNVSLLMFLCCCLTISVVKAADTRYTIDSNEMNSILASVNGEAILLSDILEITRKQEYQAYAAFSGKRLEQEIRNIRRQAVDSIIDRKLVVSDYQKQSFRISNRDIEHEIDQSALQYGCSSRQEFVQKLAQAKIDFPKFRKNLEERMIYFYMIQRLKAISGSPTPKDICEYFEANRKKLSTAETYVLSMIKLDLNQPADKIDEITKKITAHPEEFENLAKTFAPESSSGYLGAIEPAKLRVEFSVISKAPEVGKIYGPIKLDDGVAWIKLLKHNKAQDAAFIDVQSRIVQILEAENRKKNIEIYIGKLRADAVLEYFF